jgi:TPR repeat protein
MTCFRAALEEFQRLADSGDPDTQTALAMLYDNVSMYDNGHGITKNKQKAAELYTRAADVGDARAMVNLGSCYNLLQAREGGGEGLGESSRAVHARRRRW